MTTDGWTLVAEQHADTVQGNGSAITMCQAGAVGTLTVENARDPQRRNRETSDTLINTLMVQGEVMFAAHDLYHALFDLHSSAGLWQCEAAGVRYCRNH